MWPICWVSVVSRSIPSSPDGYIINWQSRDVTETHHHQHSRSSQQNRGISQEREREWDKSRRNAPVGGRQISAIERNRLDSIVASPSAEENHFVCFIFRSRTPRYIEFKLLGCNSVTDRCIRKIEKRRVDFFISLVFPLQKRGEELCQSVLFDSIWLIFVLFLNKLKESYCTAVATGRRVSTVLYTSTSVLVYTSAFRGL